MFSLFMSSCTTKVFDGPEQFMKTSTRYWCAQFLRCKKTVWDPGFIWCLAVMLNDDPPPSMLSIQMVVWSTIIIVFLELRG